MCITVLSEGQCQAVCMQFVHLICHTNSQHYLFFQTTRRLKGHLDIRKVERHRLSNSVEILLSLRCNVMGQNNFES